MSSFSVLFLTAAPASTPLISAKWIDSEEVILVLTKDEGISVVDADAGSAGQHSNPIPAMASYVPLEQPVVVVSPYFLAQYPVDLTVATKLMTLGENDFTVNDVNGTVIFRIKTHRRWQAYRGDSKDNKDLLFTVRKSSMMQLRTELAVFLAGNTKEEVPDFRVKGSFHQSSCVIYLGNTNKIIAQMYRGHSMATMLFEADHFRVTIYPNVDYAFIVSLVVILDEINADRSGED
ncbi:Protein LURP-one-related 15 [Linum perenne]